MDYLNTYSRFQNLLDTSASWKLLRSDLAPFVLAFLKELFSKNSEVEFEHARANLKQFIEDIKLQLKPDDQKRSAKDYLNEWMNNGWIRELNNHIFLTDAAQKAIEMVERLDSKTVSTSATHLEIFLQEVQKIFIQVSSDKRLRYKEINDQIKKLQQEKQQIKDGTVAVLSDYQQKEKINTLYELASKLTSDFRRVEEESIDINQKIRVQMIEDQMTKGEVLENVLVTEKEQRQTDYGAAYEGFFNLLCNTEISDKFKNQVAYILRKPIAKFLTKEQSLFLKNFIDVLVKRSIRVRDVRLKLDNNLKDFLQSSDYKESHLVNKLLSRLEQEAVKLKSGNFNLYTEKLDINIENNSIKVISIDSISQALKVPPKKVVLENISEQDNHKEISHNILRQLDTVKLSDIRESKKNSLGNTNDLSVAQIIKDKKLKYGLEEIVAYVRVAKELNRQEHYDSEEIIATTCVGGVEKQLKVKLPKIVLSRQMVIDSENEDK